MSKEASMSHTMSNGKQIYCVSLHETSEMTFQIKSI